MIKKIKTCRNCNKKKLQRLFSLGNLSYTGKFPKKKNINIPKSEITLVKCGSCHLVQLDRNFNPNYLYDNNYGYRSGINQTMIDHLKNTTSFLSKKVKIQNGDYVLDIASNDGTLLNSYKKKSLKSELIQLLINLKVFTKIFIILLIVFFLIKRF